MPNIKKLGRKKMILLIAAAVIVVLLGAYCALCAAVSGEAIFPKVTVSEVQLGKLTCGEAEAALKEAVAARTPDDAHGVVFTAVCDTGNEATMQVPLSSVETDVSASVARAWSVGNDGSFFSRVPPI